MDSHFSCSSFVHVSPVSFRQRQFFLPPTFSIFGWRCLHKRKTITMFSKQCARYAQGGKKNACINIKSNMAAFVIFYVVTNQGIALEYSEPNSMCKLAAVEENIMPLNINNTSDDVGAPMLMNGMTANTSDDVGAPMLMKGMTAQNFNPLRYSGRWFEVASLKRGFAGQGQEDCHCTQGIYTFDAENRAIQVDTFCVHGSPDGYLTGIRGKVQCLPENELENKETEVEREEMIKGKCYLRFPTLPFIPKEPYDVIATDYENFALVSGAKDRSFVQIYSRVPNPGPDFIENFKLYLSSLGYDPNQIKDTPQDCELMPTSQLALMMGKPGMQATLTNQFPDLSLERPLELNPFVSIFDTIKKLFALYFK